MKFMAAVTKEGKVMMWDENSFGQLGVTKAQGIVEVPLPEPLQASLSFVG
jgi:alpha-tubulin suppressor-like RCC1 family protein